MKIIDSKTTFVTVNQKLLELQEMANGYSKTTFVTVNLAGEIKKHDKKLYSKTTFVTVNLTQTLNDLSQGELFKNNVCYC